MKKFILRSILIIFLLCAGYLLMNFINIWQYAKTDETTDADVIIVLGAAAYESGVSPVYRERINHAVYLYNEGHADKIIMTGGVAKGNTHSDAYIGSLYAIEKGVPQEDILLEERSEITEENLSYAKVIMDEHGYDTALLVSDPLHMKRSMAMARDYGIKAYSSPTKTSMYKSKKSRRDFALREWVLYTGYEVITTADKVMEYINSKT